MRLLRSLVGFPSELRGGAVSIGNFDGVHVGHAEIVRRVGALANLIGGPSQIFSFDPHPVRLLRPAQAPPPLTWTDRKSDLLAALGMDALIAYPTDLDLLNLSPRDFFHRIIIETLGAQGIVEGSNFHFGKNREGDIQTLRSLSEQHGIITEVVDPLVVDGEPVSSSRVRRLIASGDIGSASRLLTQPYRLRGMVTHGVGRGHTIGFPTANLSAIDTLLPAQGVYACRAWLDQQTWPAATNIGPNPTFGENSLKVEVHLIGYEGSLYGQVLEVDFLERLRGIETFPDVDALKAQLRSDVEATHRIARS